MTLIQLEEELKEVRLRGAKDHTPVYIANPEDEDILKIVKFDGTITLK